MKRLILSTMLALAMPAALFAQINWTEHTIDANYDGANWVYALDLDGDSDIDVLGAAVHADDITWWENDGNENFTEHTIADNFDGAYSVYAIDLDGDSDMDVLGGAIVANNITWWENDGSENFTEHTIDSLFAGAWSVFAIDLDSDSDIDVLGAAYFAGDITWWENDGAIPPNFTEHTIDGTFTGATSVYALDLDGDSDMDVLGAGSFFGDITWWENDGSENFTEHTIDSLFDGASSVYAIDLDGDSDMDVLGATIFANDITWWENDGSENFTEHTIADDFDGAWSVYALDLDGDLDVDVLGAAQTAAGDITWWGNDGGENFTEHTISNSFSGASSVYAIDLDGDLDVDVLGAAFFTGDITWWESDLAVVDAGPVSIDISDTFPENTALNPQATVTNFGTNNASFVVTCEIDPGGYDTTETVTDLASGDSIQVTFFPEFTFESGSYTVTVYTQLAGDEDPANDTLEKVIETYDPGVAEEESATPETFSFSVPTINRGKAHIEFALPVETEVDLLIYDAIGRLSETLVSKKLSAGNHKLNINLNLPAGVYFYNLKTASGENIIKKFLLVE